MSDKTERTKEEILNDIILVNTRLHSEDVILEMFTSIPPEGCKQIILAAMEEYRQSSPVESKLLDYLKREGKEAAEFRLVVNLDGSAYVHVLGRDSETFDFKIR